MASNQASKRTKFYVSAAPVARDADMSTVADWTIVTDVTGLDGSIGDESELIKYEVYGDDNRYRKLKGSRDAGNLTVEVARIPGDAGQDAMRAAELSSEPFAFKCLLPNGDTVMFPALVMSAKRSFGDDVVKLTYPLELVDDATEVLAA